MTYTSRVNEQSRIVGGWENIMSLFLPDKYVGGLWGRKDGDLRPGVIQLYSVSYCSEIGEY